MAEKQLTTQQKRQQAEAQLVGKRDGGFLDPLPEAPPTEGFFTSKKKEKAESNQA